MKDYSELKIGSDVMGVASDVLENEVNLTDEAVFDIAAAFMPFLEKKLGKKVTELTVAVGHDNRTTAESIKEKVVEALVSSGVRVLDCGLSSTPAIFSTTQTLGTDGAIEITAGHHPADRNGFKLFTALGTIDSDDAAEILSAAAQGKRCEKADGSAEKTDFMSEYVKGLREGICHEAGVSDSDKPLDGLKIVVDASNGIGGFYADMLADLGADVSCSINLEPDGAFPNHAPDPESDLAIASVSDAVINSSADFGLCFNADADRVVLIDSDGVVLSGNRLIALVSTVVLENSVGSAVVTDSVTSRGVKAFIEDLGGKQYRFKTGYKNVISEAIRLDGEGVSIGVAIDSMGHAAFKENLFYDDGTYLASKIIAKIASLKHQGKTIFDAVSELETPLDAKEFRIGIGVDEYDIYGELVVEGVERWCEAMAEADGYEIDKENLDGVRVGVAGGWFMVKMSAHEPTLLFKVESDQKGGVKKILEKIAPFFFNCRFLDCQALIEHIEAPEENDTDE